MGTGDGGTGPPGRWRAVDRAAVEEKIGDEPILHDAERSHRPHAGAETTTGWRDAGAEIAGAGDATGGAWRPVRPVVELETGAVPRRTQTWLRVLFVAVIVSSVASFVQAMDVFILALDFEDAMKEAFLGDVQYPEEAAIRDGIRMYSGLTAVLAVVLLMAMVVLPVRYGLLIFGVGRNVPAQYRRMIAWAKILVATEVVRLLTMGIMAFEEYEVVSISVGFSWNLPLGVGIWWYLRRERVMEAYQVPIYVLPGGHRERTSI